MAQDAQPIILASILRRLCAKAIDAAACTLIYMVLLTLAKAVLPASALAAAVQACVLVALACWLFGDALPGGQSLGKWLLDIKVVHRDTQRPCTLWQAANRNATTAFVFDAFWIFVEGRLRLGDMYAKTIVVQTGKLSYKVRSFSDVYQGTKR